MADGSYAVSQAGPWGAWGGEVRCLDGEVITGFRLQVQPDQVYSHAIIFCVCINVCYCTNSGEFSEGGGGGDMYK